MANTDMLEFTGEVVETLPETKFLVQISEKEGEDKVITAYLRGKMKRYSIRILPGDRVKVEVDPKYPDIGRITYRYKD